MPVFDRTEIGRWKLPNEQFGPRRKFSQFSPLQQSTNENDTNEGSNLYLSPKSVSYENFEPPNLLMFVSAIAILSTLFHYYRLRVAKERFRSPFMKFWLLKIWKFVQANSLFLSLSCDPDQLKGSMSLVCCSHAH